MEVVLYSRSRENAKVDTSTEGLCPRIALMYAKRFSVCNFFSQTILLWQCRDTWGEHFYCHMFERLYCHDEPGGNNEPGTCFAFFEALKSLRKRKNKDKTTLVILQQSERTLKNIMTDVNNWFEFHINLHRLQPLFPFLEEEDVFVPMESKEYNEETEGEDPLIKNIVESLTYYEEDLIFDQIIESLVPYSCIDEEAKINVTAAEPFFLSMQLFSFPLLIDLDHPQLANVRNELKTVIEVFHEDYGLLKDELASISFKNEQDQIQPLLKKYMAPHLGEIQKNIDKNMYVQQAKNRYSTAMQIKVILGVTSFENQIKLLEKEEVILPFVAGAIIEKLTKDINVKNCAPFIYHIYPKINITK